MSRPRRSLVIAAVAILTVAAVVMAAVLVVMPASSRSTPESAFNSYMDGNLGHNGTLIVENSLLHFDTEHRDATISHLDDMFANISVPQPNISVTIMDDITMSKVPTHIAVDVANFTTAFQNGCNVTVQESRFLKVDMTQKNSSMDSYSVIQFILFSEVEGRWYLDMYLIYSAADWAADHSIGYTMWSELFNYSSVQVSDPIGSFTSANNLSGYWEFSLSWIDYSTVKYTDCGVKLSVGGSSSDVVPIPESKEMTIPLYEGTATGYTFTFIDMGASGYLSSGDMFMIGPINGQSGLNAIQPNGTDFTVSLIYIPTGGIIAYTNFITEGVKPVIIVDAPVAYGYANHPSTGLKAGFVIPTNEHYGICIAQNQVSFRNAVNSVINEMVLDGSMQALLLKYDAI